MYNTKESGETSEELWLSHPMKKEHLRSLSRMSLSMMRFLYVAVAVSQMKLCLKSSSRQISEDKTHLFN